MTWKIIPVGQVHEAELYQKYDENDEHQRVFIDIDFEDKTISMDWLADDVEYPQHLYQHLYKDNCLHIQVEPFFSEEANKLMHEILPMIKTLAEYFKMRVFKGKEQRIFTMTKESQCLLFALQTRVENYCFQTLNVSEKIEAGIYTLPQSA